MAYILAFSAFAISDVPHGTNTKYKEWNGYFYLIAGVGR